MIILLKAIYFFRGTDYFTLKAIFFQNLTTQKYGHKLHI